jgi:uncharacterized RDD family membrane protein YckC
MNSLPFRKIFPGAALALSLALSAGAFAEEPATPVETSAPPAVETPASEMLETPAPEVPEAPTPPAEAEMRRLDVIEPKVEAPKATEAPAEKVAEVALEGSDDAAETEPGVRTKRARVRTSSEFPFGNHAVAAGNTVREMVSIMGSNVVDGEVTREVVSIMGNTRINGSVGREAVAVMGSVHVEGSVGREVVAVLGNVYINGQVGHEVVSVLGDVDLGPEAVIGHDLVVVGGRLTRDPAAVVKGSVKVVTLPIIGSGFAPVKTWIERCLLLGRPLAFGEHLGWAWLIAISVFAFYVLLALLFPRAFEKCAETLEQRPGYSLLAVLLTVLITPVLIVLLAITGIGVLLIPFVAAGLFFAGIFGKAVMHAWLGRRITRYFGPGPMTHVASATVIGSVLVLMLYTVPFLGFFTYKVLDIIGLGVVVYTLILTMRREKPAVPLTASGLAAAAVVVPGSAAASGVIPPGLPSMDATATAESGDVAGLSTSSPPPVVGALLPRAGFWLRIAASAIDAVLVGMLTSFTKMGGSFPLVFAVYCIVLWALKGTTVGGIVCSLKVVRLDERKVDWAVAVVRGLGGFLSLFVAGLGFIWVAFDQERQSWHDKIAGTTIVRVPKGVSLI